jgi:hypothetical protein
VPIELLKPGDLVVTQDNGPQPLAWIGTRRVGRRKLARDPAVRPVRIAPRLLGTARPLVVSPQHGVLLTLGGQEVLVRAVHLAQLAGAGARVLAGCRGVTYIHLMFEAHQIVFANGAPSESFYPGPFAMGALATEARTRVTTLFPGLKRVPAAQSYGATARPFFTKPALAQHLS